VQKHPGSRQEECLLLVPDSYQPHSTDSHKHGCLIPFLYYAISFAPILPWRFISVVRSGNAVRSLHRNLTLGFELPPSSGWHSSL
jgi:hypothetical protein